MVQSYKLIIRITINKLSKDKKSVKANQGNLRNLLKDRHLLKLEGLIFIVKRAIDASEKIPLRVFRGTTPVEAPCRSECQRFPVNC